MYWLIVALIIINRFNIQYYIDIHTHILDYKKILYKTKRQDTEVEERVKEV